MSNNHNKPRTHLNGKPYDFSVFYAPDEVKGWLAEEPTGNPDSNTESAATSTGKPLQPGDYIPGEVREAFAKRIGLGDVANAGLPVALDPKETNK
jgi:hypothetical protein